MALEIRPVPFGCVPMLLRLLLAAMVLTGLGSLAQSAEPLAIGSRLEPLVDDYLIEHLDGAELKLHAPTSREVAIEHDKPWEGNVCAYHTVFQDGPIYRMYYRGCHWDEKKGMAHEVTCYAKSPDGIRWTKPELGLVEFTGSKQNSWKGGTDVSQLAGKPIRLRFVMKDADLYAVQFK